ncbi:hypothetical protein MTsDn1_26080 [Alteromonas sp. MTD1]|uniref:hypothetical protein n=1 Tax=Alteromonas sp. MTD1 TaxID=3057962 RepID=UPI0036F3CA5E
MHAPNFKSAQFSLSLDNPFKLTPPREQAFFGTQQYKAHADQVLKEEVDSEQSTTTKMQQAADDVKSAYAEKVRQGASFFSLLNSELMLVKKSIIVTVFASLATLAIGAICWLLINAILGTMLYHYELGLIFILAILLTINILATLTCFKLAKTAFEHASFDSLINTASTVFSQNNDLLHKHQQHKSKGL